MKTSDRLSRREFLVDAAGAIGGALLSSMVPGCGRKTDMAACPKTRHGSAGSSAAIRGFTEETGTSFPLLEVSGEPFDIGYAIGKRFAAQVRKGFEDNAGWWKDLKRFVASSPAEMQGRFLAAAERHAPDAVMELRGWAKGSGVPFEDLLILNLKCEYGALMDSEKAKKRPDASPGCSTLVLNDGKRILIAHNEDGDKAYSANMFMLKVRPSGKPSFLAASYPGILPGNAPWVNDRGVIMTTNFIYSKSVRFGVGRYFLDRLAMQARSADEALTISRNPDRAYSYHHVIASAPERRVFSLEVTPENEHLAEIKDLFIHTNHLLAPNLSAEAQDLDYVKSSSLTRLEVLTRWKAGRPDIAALSADDLVSALSSHEGRPYSPCRHPEGEIRGSTLLTAVFDLDRSTMKVYKNQPCLNQMTEYPFPT